MGCAARLFLGEIARWGVDSGGVEEMASELGGGLASGVGWRMAHLENCCLTRARGGSKMDGRRAGVDGSG